MDRRTFLTAVGVSLPTSLAGCTGFGGESPTPTPTGRSTFVNVHNMSDWTLVFTTVAFSDGLGGVTIEYRDGSERTFEDAETVDDLSALAWDGAVTFTPGNDVPRREFRSTGSSGTAFEFPNTTAGTTVVTTVTRPALEDSLLSLSVGTCGEVDTSNHNISVDASGRVTQHVTCGDETSE